MPSSDRGGRALFPPIIDPNQEYLIDVDQVVVPPGYHREDLGDLDALGDNVKAHGVIEPIVTDEYGELLGGLRRLSAARKKCLKRVPVKVRECRGDQGLKARIRESLDLHNKPLTKAERDKAGDNIRAAVEAEAAKRKAATQAKAGKVASGSPQLGSPGKPAKKHAGETNEIIGRKTGRGRETVRKRAAVLESGQADVIARMNETGRIDPAYKEVVERKRQAEAAPAVDEWAAKMSQELAGMGRTLAVMQRLIERKDARGDAKASAALPHVAGAIASLDYAREVLR